MTLVMVLGTLTGLSPMPEPIPVALTKMVFGAMEQPLLIAIGLVAHFLYGGIASIVFANLFRRAIGPWSGLGYAVLLWLVMQIVFLPMLGWGLFGSNITPSIAVATLILHLIYGGVLGWGFDYIKQEDSSDELSP